ncbi:hypothetical protein THAOC_11905 [Thalassiosira oceanica]|uniref:Uncharacterized protein n=1 Tax=Thalassiosira oceanica TaxID=159749 RepID=K0SQ48_THAOC|nr:hypothetical protein THAOC_11905 [Thalassiosira oceanica]|eukprot:EJK67104.1 hypothetical protein THAOC_11905 [Thalassiosira oceanica]
MPRGVYWGNANSQRRRWEAGSKQYNGGVNSQSTHLAKDGSNPAHGKKEQAADDHHHPELAEKKNLPEDNGTQKVSDGTSLIHSECSDLDLMQLKWT